MESLKKLLLSQTIRDTLISFVGLGTTAIIGFFFTIIIAKHFGPENFGVYSAIVAFMTIVFTLTDMGITSSIVNFVPKNQDKRNSFVNTGFSIELTLGSVALLIFSLLSIKPNIIVPGANSSSLLLAGLLGFNYIFIGLIQAIFSADRKFVLYSLTQIVDAVIKIILILILLSTNNLSIQTAFLANIASTLISFIFTYRSNILKIKFDIDKIIFQKIFHFAKWVALTRTFSVFISRIDVILLNLLTTNFEAGIFSAANRITMLFSLVISSLGSVVSPRFSSFDNKKKVWIYMKKLIFLISLFAIGMLAIAFIAKPIILIVFGEKYAPAILVFQALTIAMIPFMYTLITSSALIYSFNLPAFTTKMTIIQVILITISDLLLIPKLGAIAPSISLGLSNLFVLLFSSIKLKRLFSDD